MSEAVVLEHAAACETDFLVYTGNFCGYCRALKNLLNRKELTFTEITATDADVSLRQVGKTKGEGTEGEGTEGILGVSATDMTISADEA